MRQIAIIDDDPQALEGMKEVIPWDMMGCEWAGEAQNGEAGLALIRKLNPSIVITDIYMPVMDGLQMIEQLRNGGYKGKIIILSGYSDFEYARKALRLQVDDYLSKPVTVDEIVDVLRKTLQALEEEDESDLNEHQLRQKLMLYEPFVVSEWIKSVLTGTYVAHQIHQKVIESLQKRWETYAHRVLIVELVPAQRPTLLSYSDISLFRFAVCNLIQEMTAEAWPESVVVELQGPHLALLLHMHADSSHASAYTEEVAERLCRRIVTAVEHYLNLQVKVGMGQVKTSWKQISDSAEEAFQAIDERQAPGMEGAHPARRSFKFGQQLSEALLGDDVDLAATLVQQFADSLRLNEQSDPWLIQSAATDLWSTVSYSLFLGGEPVDHLYQQSVVYQEIQALQTLEQLQCWIRGKIMPICTTPRKLAGFKHRQTVELMMQIAHSSYAQDITLESLSDQLFLSRNYLNKIFKQAVGETFTSYVTRVRMEKAKALIAEGKYLIYEIAEKVGYKNIPYFSAKFRKHFGVNPSDL